MDTASTTAAVQAASAWPLVNGLLAATALALAVALRPWRCIGGAGPPMAWGLCWLLSTLFLGSAPAQPWPTMTFATLLMLLAGWPLAVIALVGAGILCVAGAGLAWGEALNRIVWLGIVPASVALLVGAAVRRWLPRHLLAYILGRGVLGTLLATGVALALACALHPAAGGVEATDLFVAWLLTATAEATLCGTIVGILVIWRPQCLATYAERHYAWP